MNIGDVPRPTINKSISVKKIVGTLYKMNIFTAYSILY